MRVLLFSIGLIICSALILPIILGFTQGWWFIAAFFIVGFVIQVLERKAGWVDDWYYWIEE